MHDVIVVSVPLFAIFAGILFNRGDVRRLEDRLEANFNKMQGEVRELRAEMNARFNAVDAELRFFHGVTGKLEGRIEALEKR